MIENEMLDAQVIEKNYSLSSKGSRFTNHLIDTIVVYAIIFGITFYQTTAEMQNGTYVEDKSVLLEYLFTALIMILYYTTLEFFLKGKSIGKFLTKTRAVTLDYDTISLQDALIRSVSRLVPFEAFSFLGSDSSGWHDKWSKTVVIDDHDWKESY